MHVDEQFHFKEQSDRSLVSSTHLQSSFECQQPQPLATAHPMRTGDKRITGCSLRTAHVCAVRVWMFSVASRVVIPSIYEVAMSKLPNGMEKRLLRFASVRKLSIRCRDLGAESRGPQLSPWTYLFCARTPKPEIPTRPRVKS